MFLCPSSILLWNQLMYIRLLLLCFFFLNKQEGPRPLLINILNEKRFTKTFRQTNRTERKGSREFTRSLANFPYGARVPV
jgi:hypothetical protein